MARLLLRKPLKTLFLAACLGLLCIHLNYRWVGFYQNHHAYDDLQKIAHNEVGIVLGTSSRLSDGRPNLFFEARMDAAAELYQAGKVDRLLVSGSHSGKYYNEAEEMTRALLSRGVPAEVIDTDPNGHRTLDSIVRAHTIYKLKTFTIVSQPFHNQRALYISRHKGIPAIAYNAQRVRNLDNVRAQIREHGSRILMMLDLYLLDTQPRVME